MKVCGVTTLKAALAAVDAGADMVGLNFHPPSVRYLEPEAAKRLSRAVARANPRVLRVGVFVNCAPHVVLGLLEQCELDLAQLSGDETPADLGRLDGRAFKAVRSPQDAGRFARTDAPALLFDADVPGFYGGAGRQADWTAAERLAREYPLMLAGGLTPENVAGAVAAVQPWGVDVASGVESAPAIKDPLRMAAFVRAAKGQQWKR